MKHSLQNTLLLWLTIAVALVLLGPYAGIHILSSPPAAFEEYNQATDSISTGPRDIEPTDAQDTGGTHRNPGEELDDIKGLLAEQ